MVVIGHIIGDYGNKTLHRMFVPLLKNVFL